MPGISLHLDLGSSVMMMLGPIRFAIDAAAYQELKRKSEYRWPTMERLGRPVAHQFIGVGEDTLDLKGIIYPGYDPGGGAIGIGRVDEIRAIAEQGIPLPLITGYGDSLGNYVIKSVEDTGSYFYQDGAPRKQEFSIELAAYGDDGTGLDGIVFAGGFFHVPRVQFNLNLSPNGFGINFGIG